LVRVHHPERPTKEFRGLELGKRHRLVLGYGGGISGWARDRQTKGFVSPLEISLKPDTGSTQRRTFPSGKFEWTGLQAGKYQLTVDSPGYAPLERAIRIPEGRSGGAITREGLHFWMDMAGKIAGFVRDERMFPVDGAEVWCSGAGFAGSSRAVTTNPKGEFVLNDLPPGVCVLRVAHRDKGKARIPGVVVESGRVTDEVAVELAGTPTEARGPRAGVAVELRARGDDVVIASVRAGAAAEKAGLAAGDIVVSVDGETTEGLGLSTIEGLLTGPVGSTVILEVRRKGKVVKVPVRRELLRRGPGR
jgi:hypothetical protein